MADFCTRLAVGHADRWSNAIILRVIADPLPVWRSSEGTQIWQPFGNSTLARILLNLLFNKVRWVEIQTTDHVVIRYDAFDLAFQEDAERLLRILPQGKKRKSGVWKSKDGTTNRLLLRVPHK